MAELLARHLRAEQICGEELLGKKHSHPTQVLSSDGSGGINTTSSEAERGERAGMAGNRKSPSAKQEQGSVQQARPVQMLKKVIWEAFTTGMAALLLHRKAKASRALLAHGHNIQELSHHPERTGDFSSKQQQKRVVGPFAGFKGFGL